MKNFILKLTSLVLVFMMVFAMSACGKKDDATGEDSSDDASQDISLSESEEESTGDDIEDVSETEESETEESREESVTEPENKKPETKEEIVQYYVDAANKVKTSAKSVHLVYTNTINYQNILEIGNNKTIEKVAQTLMGMFLKEDTKRYTYTSKDDYVRHFPPARSAACTLDASMVDVAECKDLGDAYEIKIVLNSSLDNPDVMPTTGVSKAAAAFNVVDIQDVLDAAGTMVKLENMQNSYFDATLVCKIDKETGNMTHLEQKLPSTMGFSKASVLIVSVNNVRVGLEYQHKWEIDW